MSENTEKDKEFYEIADAFIAARFDTFLVASCVYCHHIEDKRKFGALFG